jgi:hypothetical protein
MLGQLVTATSADYFLSAVWSRGAAVSSPSFSGFFRAAVFDTVRKASRTDQTAGLTCSGCGASAPVKGDRGRQKPPAGGGQRTARAGGRARRSGRRAVHQLPPPASATGKRHQQAPSASQPRPTPRRCAALRTDMTPPETRSADWPSTDPSSRRARCRPAP